MRWPDSIEWFRHGIVAVWVVQCEPALCEWHIEHRYVGVHLGWRFGYDEETDDCYGTLEDERYVTSRDFGPFSWGRCVFSHRGSLA